MFGILNFAPLPIIFGIIFTTNLCLVYVWAVLRGDVDPLLPYVSSAADKRPEACVFAIGTNLCAMLSFFIIFLRYKYSDQYFESTEDAELPFLKRFNYISCCVGFLAAFGMFIVANVQETALISVHMIAALTTFTGGTIYMIMQTVITYELYKARTTSKSMVIIRSVLSALSVICLLSAIILGAIASRIFHSYYPDLPTPRPWNRKYWQPGMEYHTASAAFEWIVAVLHCMFIITFTRDFEYVTVDFNVSHEIDEEERTRLLL